MKSRYLVLGLSLVFAIALAVPAFGGPTNPIASISASVKQTANKALKTAKAAQQTANSAASAAASAQSTANSANSTAATALKEAKTAQTNANTAQSTANTAKTTADAAKTAAAAAQATANSKFGNTNSDFGEFATTSATNSKVVLSVCSPGQITGGGYETTGAGANSVTATYTGSYGDSWLAALERVPGGGATTWSVRAIAICAVP
jgi:trimeric autotransporter adhesin